MNYALCIKPKHLPFIIHCSLFINNIRRLLLALFIGMTALTASAQVEAFEKYSEEKDVTYVYISRAMLQLAGKIAAPTVPGMNIGAVLNKLDAIQIVTSENKTMRAKLKTDVAQRVKHDKYELLMQMDEDGERVRIYHRGGKKQSVIIMSTDEESETSIIVFSGKFTLDDVKMKKASPNPSKGNLP